MKEKIKKLRLQGKGYTTIAKDLNMTKENVRYHCNELGLTGATENDLINKCVYCGKEIEENINGFCDNVCQGKYYAERARLIDYGTATCKVCGKEFEKKSTNQIYCSRQCCKRNYKPKISKLVCKKCGKEFESTKKSKKYCSDECRYKPHKHICKACGKTFIRNGAQQYCSNECRYETRICKNCGKEFRTFYSSSKELCSRRCAVIKARKSHEQYYKEFSRIHKGQVVPITKYNGNNHNITIYCLECNKKTTRRADRFVRDRQGCEHCGRQLSVGEKIIEQYLIDNDVKYESQYIPKSFGDIKYRYDFAILNEDGTVLKLIEYDGRQHFEPVEDFGGEKEFKKQVERDVFKARAAREKGIELTRISYKEKNNIYKILEGLCI